MTDSNHSINSIQEFSTEQFKNITNPIWLLDTSWLLHRYHHALKWMSAGNGGRLTGHIHGVLTSIKTIREYHKSEHNIENPLIILCLDSQTERKAKNSEYKAGRAELEFNIFKDLPLIQASAYLIPNTFTAKVEGYEADDLLYSLAQTFSQQNPDSQIHIYSGDDDTLQSLTLPNINLVRNISPVEYITEETLTTDKKFIEKYQKCPPNKLQFFRPICGDKSDNLKGIERFPKKLAAFIASKVNSISEVKTFAEKLIESDAFHFKPSEYKALSMLISDFDHVLENYSFMKLQHIDVPLQHRKPNSQMVLSRLREFKLEQVSNYIEQQIG